MCLNPSPRTGRSVVTTKHSQTELLNVKNVITNVDKARDGEGGGVTLQSTKNVPTVQSMKNVRTVVSVSTMYIIKQLRKRNVIMMRSLSSFPLFIDVIIHNNRLNDLV